MNDKNPLETAVERALDAFLYAPIGLIFEGPEMFPELVQKGRNQVTMAKMMGEFAVKAGQDEAAKAIDQGRDQLLETLGALGVPGFAKSTSPWSSSPDATDATDPTSTANRPKAPEKAAKKTTARRAAKKAPRKRPDLAIPDYDTLSASQVVTRLAGLSKAELEAVREHEAANRGRKTILNKVAQIQA